MKKINILFSLLLLLRRQESIITKRTFPNLNFNKLILLLFAIFLSLITGCNKPPEIHDFEGQLALAPVFETIAEGTLSTPKINNNLQDSTKASGLDPRYAEAPLLPDTQIPGLNLSGPPIPIEEPPVVPPPIPPPLLGGLVVPASCGDGHKTPVEQCDDGNRINNDGCNNFCQLAACGNGVTDGIFVFVYRTPPTIPPPPPEVVNDPLNAPTNTNIAKDIISLIQEECDDGNLEEGDGCNYNCYQEYCGNSYLDPGEECDAGPLVVVTPAAGTTPATFRGNGATDAQGNPLGCSITCKYDPPNPCPDKNKQ